MQVNVRTTTIIVKYMKRHNDSYLWRGGFSYDILVMVDWPITKCHFATNEPENSPRIFVVLSEKTPIPFWWKTGKSEMY